MGAKSPQFEFDVAVLGGGSAGYAAARSAAAHGLKTAVIEGGKEVGGLCILRGCMPTKALLYAAEVMHLASHPQPWGIRTEDVGFNWSQVLARKNALVSDFADYRRKQLTDGRFTFIRGQACFADPHTIVVDGNRRVSARHIIIATGSIVAPCPLPQLNTLECADSDSILKLERLPKSLIVLGGGAVAVEFAQIFCRFGVKVTMIQRSPHILHEFDADAAEVLETVLRREGVVLYTGTKLLDARKLANEKEVAFEHAGKTLRVRAEEIFYGLGRIPNIAHLALEKAGVQVEFGRVVTNGRMQTSVPHIYAAGDCTGLHEIVHIAIQQGEIAVNHIAHPEEAATIDYRLLTEIIFTEPQLAVVGLTEKRAHVESIPYAVAKYPFNDHGKSLIMEAKDGFVKLLAAPASGELLGGCCVGPVAGELIHEIIAALFKRMTARELAAMPHYHPTLAEIWTYPAEELAEETPVPSP